MLGIHTINHYNKWLFNLVFVGETLQHERYHESKQNQTTKKNTQLVIQLNRPKHNRHKLTLIWSYSYDPQSGNEVAPFREFLCREKWRTAVTCWWRQQLCDCRLKQSDDRCNIPSQDVRSQDPLNTCILNISSNFHQTNAEILYSHKWHENKNQCLV